MALTFRKAVPSERDEAQRILWMAFTPYVRDLGREITAHHYTFLAAAIERGDVYFALEDGEIVGVAATERRGDGIYIDRLGVAPARQGTGLGSFLLERVEEIARSSGLKELSLETAEMAEGNVRLYRRHGFEIVRRGPPSHGMDAHTRVFMVKPL
ncbi:GNAT family N-acetyltransferase [Reyranella sp.]|uniref:GNAT family N-acetyltransferase n=1 Tax=Reyranella sp. TaxID=1929291 RepID=UPI002730837A|nr:GNAT family N-acetyltransferase [Reyranella sp.]MDP2373261.1 GNAT family N-acetyltransferase [Reyranella sp.]